MAPSRPPRPPFQAHRPLPTPSHPPLLALERFELSTSRLSSARSNQLSYRPGKRGGRPSEERETEAAVSRKGSPKLPLHRLHVFLSTRKERDLDGLRPHASQHP